MFLRRSRDVPVDDALDGWRNRKRTVQALPYADALVRTDTASFEVTLCTHNGHGPPVVSSRKRKTVTDKAGVLGHGYE